jgi:2-polyprenyl-3-methyl-5-hydroxy-6-metoxy-1,4-benzoquinol methylase
VWAVLADPAARLSSPEATAGTARPRAALGCVGSDPVEAAAVRAGWELVELHERLGAASARDLLRDRQEAEVERARTVLPHLTPWPGLGGMHRAYSSPTNRIRFARTADCVLAGDGLLDIGLGKGWQAGTLLLTTSLASYRGIDLDPRNVAATRAMLAANGLEGRNVEVTAGDLYDLNREQVGAAGARLVVCCEVLEHTPDPERALEVLGAALPDGAELLFSVPMLGRLDGVWGHVTIFDAARVKTMLERAGLYAHHVEALANTWTKVLASATPGPSARVREMAERAALELPVPALEHRDFVRVDLSVAQRSRSTRRSTCDVTASERGAKCTVSQPPNLGPAGPMELATRVAGRLSRSVRGAAPRVAKQMERALRAPQLDALDSAFGGIAFPVRGLHALRLEVELSGTADVARVLVDGYSGQTRVARWTWRPSTSDAVRRTTVLRPGRSGPFAAARVHHSAEARLPDADTVEVTVQVRSGGAATLRVPRAAYLR